MTTFRKFCLLLSLVGNASAGSRTPCLPSHLQGRNRSERFTMMKKNWASHELVTAGLAIVMQEVLGYDVEIRPPIRGYAYESEGWRDFATGEFHVDAEMWNTDFGSARYQLCCTGGGPMEWIGGIGYGGRSGLYTFNHTVAAHKYSDYYKFFEPSTDGVPQSFNDFVRFGEIDMAGRSYCDYYWCTGSTYVSPKCLDNPSDCPVVLSPTTGWDTAFFDALILNHGLKLIILFLGWGYAEPDGEVQTLFKQRRNTVFYHWQPDLMHQSVDTVRISFPAYHMGCPGHSDILDSPVWCDYPEHALVKGTVASLRSTNPEAYAVFKKFTVSEAELNGMARNYLKNGDATESACTWLLGLSKARWEDLVPSCIRMAPINPRPGDLVFDPHILSCQEQLGQVNCTNGTVYMSSFNQCVCAAGQFLDGKACAMCDTGKFSASLGMKSCDECPPGRFTDTRGVSACARCKVGTFNAVSGQSACEPCPLAGSATEFAGAESVEDCKCSQGSYFEGGSCASCPDGMICPWGADSKPGALIHPLLKASYWSSSKNPLSVYRCENDKKCPGGDPGTCLSKLEDQSCAHCELGWAWNGEHCVECSSAETSKVIFPALPIVLFPIIIVILYMFYGDKYDRWSSWQNGFSAMLFVALNHYQIISLARGADIKFPIEVAGLWDVLLVSGDVSTIFRPACAGFADFQSSLLIKLLGPAVITSIFLIVWASSRALANLFNDPLIAMTKDRTLNTYFGLIFTFFAGIAAMAFTIFKCSPNPNGKKTLVIDRSVTCYESDWSGMLAVGLLSVLFWCFGYGAIFIRTVLVAPYRFSDEGFQMRWKFLFIKFRPDVYWFSLVVLSKGVLMNFGFIFLNTGVAQIYWLFVFVALYLSLNVAFRPWRHMAVNAFDTHAHICLLVVLLALSWFAKNEEEELTDLNQDMTNLIIAFTFLLIPMAIPVYVHILYSRVSQKYREKMRQNVKVMQHMIKKLAMEEHFRFENWMMSLNEWDFWFMKQATSIISTEFLGFKFNTEKCVTRELSQHGFSDLKPPTLVEEDALLSTAIDVKVDGIAGKATAEAWAGARTNLEMLEAVNEMLQASETPKILPKLDTQRLATPTGRRTPVLTPKRV